MNFEKSNILREKAHRLIPGGAHTYAKGDDQYPVLSPGFVVRGKGSHVWDADGNEFIEYGMGLRSVTLGHAYAPVVEAAARQLQLGLNFVRPATIEVEAAEMLLSMISGAEMVKFGKNGSDATTAAVKLARAYTGRDLVAICADHPFFSVDDWFIATTPMDSGIPQAVADLTVSFHYNDLASVQRLFDQYPGQIACVIMEAERGDPPLDGFLHKTRDLCHANGALFILDEIITGFRWDNGGAQKVHDIVPDLSTFGKALANGFSLSALVGRRDIMELGGLRHGPRTRLPALDHLRRGNALAGGGHRHHGHLSERRRGWPSAAAGRAPDRRHRAGGRGTQPGGVFRRCRQAVQSRLLHQGPGTPVLTALPDAVSAGNHQARAAHALAGGQLLARRRGH